jgi:hypothetical protein
MYIDGGTNKLFKNQIKNQNQIGSKKSLNLMTRMYLLFTDGMYYLGSKLKLQN